MLPVLKAFSFATYSKCQFNLYFKQFKRIDIRISPDQCLYALKRPIFQALQKCIHGDIKC